jgi:tetratricopeptide (TPR) repeat protein
VQRRSSSTPRRRTAIIAPLVAALLGIVLLALAVPRLVAAFYLLPGDPGMALLDSGQLPSPAAYERIIVSRRAAASWLPASSTLVDLGVASLSLAQVSVGRRARLLAQAERQLRAGLAGAPADPHAWTYLAFIHTATGDHERAARALDLALRIGPYQPELALPRAALGLTNWPWLGRGTVARLGAELAHALRLAPDRFVADVVDSGRKAEVRAALAVTPAARQAFERGLVELGRQSPSGGAGP